MSRITAVAVALAAAIAIIVGLAGPATDFKGQTTHGQYNAEATPMPGAFPVS